MRDKKAIIFDLEGVVIDTEYIWEEVEIEFLKRRKIEASQQVLDDINHQLMGVALEEGMAAMMAYFNLKGDLNELVVEKRNIATELLKRDITFIPGFEEFFKKVKGNYQVAVATSIERLFFKSIDQHLHITKIFNSHVYSIEDIGFISKPNPEIFLHAALKLEVDPKYCVVIEDAPKGIVAANRAGMYSIAITTSAPKEKLTHAKKIITAYSELSL